MKNGVLPSSNFVDLVETHGGGGVWGGNSEDLEGHMRKLDPNKSGSLDRFVLVRWYVDEEVYLDSTEETECLVGWG